MKCTVTIDPTREEEAILYVHRRTELTDKIEGLLKEEPAELLGYKGNEIVFLDESDVLCFTVEDAKVYAVLEKEKYALKRRLYQLEATLDGRFVKIHQSCIANLKKIRKFDVSPGGALKVIFQNGRVDYVSRRQIKLVKERLGM